MSENSIGVPAFNASRMSFAFASASAFCARAAASWALKSPSCWFDSIVLLLPTNRLVLERYCSTLASACGDVGAQPVDLAGQPRAGRTRLLLLRGLLQHEIGLGDGIGDLRGKLRILRFELDRDHPRLLHLEGGQPLVIALEHPFLGRHVHRVPDDAGEAEQGAQQAGSAEERVEFRPLAELELLDDLPREIARQDELDLARHRLLVDGGGPLDRLFRIRPEKDVLAGFDQNPRFRLVSGGDEIDGGECDRRGEKRQPGDQQFLAPERATQRSEIDFGGLRDARPPVRLYASLHDHLTPTRTTRDS